MRLPLALAAILAILAVVPALADVPVATPVAAPASPVSDLPADLDLAGLPVAAPLPEAVAATMKQHSWRAGCPVVVEALSYVRVPFWGYDGASHAGELVVDAALVDDVVAIFGELYAARFPLERVRLVDHYRGDDDASMADNNTSGFNCRWVSGRRGVYSNHSWGRAIDVNPATNPFVTKAGVFPPSGRAFLDRTKPAAGLIDRAGVVYRAFTSRGWTWGGDWSSVKDYQHFEKK